MKGFIIIFILVILAIPVAKYVSCETIEVTIKDKESIVNDGEHKYLIYTNDEVFKNVDSFMFLKWNSSDVQNNLDIGETYSVKVSGWRVPFLSTYRNVISIE